MSSIERHNHLARSILNDKGEVKCDNISDIFSAFCRSPKLSHYIQDYESTHQLIGHENATFIHQWYCIHASIHEIEIRLLLDIVNEITCVVVQAASSGLLLERFDGLRYSRRWSWLLETTRVSFAEIQQRVLNLSSQSPLMNMHGDLEERPLRKPLLWWLNYK